MSPSGAKFRACAAAIGRLCEKCKLNLKVGGDSNFSTLVSTIMATSLPAGDGKCVICDSYVRPATLVRICDECNYGSYAGRCTICGGIGISDAYYCKECTLQEKDVRLLLCCSALSVTLGGSTSHECAPTAEGWLSKNCEPWFRKDRFVLRAKKVWIQEAMTHRLAGTRLPLPAWSHASPLD